MAVLKDIEIHISIDDLLRAQGSAAQRPAVREVTQWAIAEAQRLAEPAAVWDLLPVHRVDGERARVGEALLRVGPHADLLAPACQALVSVVTIGPVLEEEVRRLIQEGSLLESFVLDSAGVLALARSVAAANWHTARQAGLGSAIASRAAAAASSTNRSIPASASSR